MSNYQEVKGLLFKAFIVTALSYFLFTPFFRFVSPLILEWSAKFFVSFSDSIYKNAALGEKNYLDVFFLMTFTSCVLGCGLGFIRVYISKKDKKLLQSESKDFLRKPVILTIVLTVFFCSLFIINIKAFTNLQLNTSFQQRITIIAPHISEQEEKEIKARWASMQNRADYRIICDKIFIYAQKNGIKLPKSLF